MNERNELIKYRLQQAEETLQTARFLMENRKDVSAIANRIYYACFYAILSLLVEKQIGTSKHSGVISAFDREFVKTGIFTKEDSMNIHKAFAIRQEYDYREFVSYNIEEIELLLDKIEKFIIRVKKYFEMHEVH